MDRSTRAGGQAATTSANTRQSDEVRLRSKELREQNELAAQRATRTSQPPARGYLASDDVYVVGDKNARGKRSAPNTATGSMNVTHSPSKRPHASIAVSDVPANSRNAGSAQDVEIRPAKKFAKFVDYNFSAMTDTKGGFLSTEDDPFNKAFADTSRGGNGQEARPAHMTVAEWERMQTIRNLKRLKQGPYEPGLSVLAEATDQKRCVECNSLEIDFVWEDVFHVCVCNPCKDKFPEKYSLLTKTECREDYLLTDPELKDAELLPHLSKPNPHKSHWHDMMLFLRCQVEEYAINTKWGSAEALDAEFERREADKKRRKDAKFKEKLLQLKKKTRSEAYRRNATGKGSADGETLATTFGDAVGNRGRHVHEWGRAIENDNGMSVKRCISCGMEVEELEF
ncbi:DNA repair protein [Sporothrix schenckii ATCC 58251]|uniref:DNA repair protein RAD14 n=1 Tax=Sporothrix schenckii (strain ATCC 58251 / de Perez 2211183) TaxID=1391915 RepID=U7PKP9_SPOS1|nr:DNA repair protein [Sporothrix schenckii ATCC 58251]